MRFLIDECLPVSLSQVANEAGYESAHLSRIGKVNWHDWSLRDYAFENDWVLVTNNKVDFEKYYRTLDVHPGVVILVKQQRLEAQREVFRTALEHLEGRDLMNLAVEVDVVDGQVQIDEYELHLDAAPRPRPA